MTFARRPPRPDRSDEFASWAPRDRRPSDGSGLLALVQPAPAAPRLAGTDAAGERYMARVAALPCVLCRILGRHKWPVEVHHVRQGQGMAQRAADFLTLPACPECHRGPAGIHGNRNLLRQANVTEIDLLAETIAQLMEAA